MNKSGLILLLIFAVSGCSEAVVKKDQISVSFYELCFNFPKMPENSTLEDVTEASEIYTGHLNKKGITVLKKRSSKESVCYFIDSITDFSTPQTQTSNNIADYLLKAYFKKKNSSLFGIKQQGRSFFKVHDFVPMNRKLPLHVEKNEGMVFTGLDRKILFLARYLEALEIPNIFGLNEVGRMIVEIGADRSDRWKMLPFLFEALDLESLISPVPGDYAIINNCNISKIDMKLNVQGWELSPIPVAAGMGVGSEDAFVFSVSLMSLPFNEETLLKFFYSMANSYLLPPSSGLYYSPNFKGSTVRPVVHLFSSELAVTGEHYFTPEMIYMWVSSVNRQLEEYPDAFYANLLSLKIAKKMFTGTPSFLGGSELVNMTTVVPFEKIREMLFHKGNVTVFGAISSSLYLYNEDIVSEFSTVKDIAGTKRVKAVYGSADNSDRSVISIITRSSNAEILIGDITEILKTEGHNSILTLFEQVSINDAWGAVSIVVRADDEKKILELYEKRFKLLNNNVSIGVYRVEKK